MQLQVIEHEVTGDPVELEAAHRVVFDIAGEEATYTTEPVTLTAPAHVLSFELVEEAAPEAKLSATVEVEPGSLIRLDSVAFPPGGVAYLHVHRGPGIRVLLQGTIRIDTDGASTDYAPLQAWFEAGPIPVFAAASRTVDTRFVRCMVLPGELLGKRSLTYVRDEDADKPKLQTYQVFVDEPLADLTPAP